MPFLWPFRLKARSAIRDRHAKKPDPGTQLGYKILLDRGLCHEVDIMYKVLCGASHPNLDDPQVALRRNKEPIELNR